MSAREPVVTGGVVVGVDGSDASLAALSYAAWAAARQELPLQLVFCQAVPDTFAVLSLAPDPSLVESGVAAAQALDDLAEQARVAFPRLAVSTCVVAGSPAGTLVRLSREASLVVVGSRGLGGFAGLMLGSASAALAAHSAAPVVVIRPTDARVPLGAPPPDGPVVVGVDGVPDESAGAIGAIECAFAEAARRGVPVVVLYAWWMVPTAPVGPLVEGVVPVDPGVQAAEEDARRLLARASAGAAARHPEVTVELRPAHALNPAVALLEASATAGLLVVSRHGGNALTRLLFSSIGDVAVREASCPVMVVPDPRPARTVH